jgi:hypothetical protein
MVAALMTKFVLLALASLLLCGANAVAQSVIQGQVTGVDGRGAQGAQVRIQSARGQQSPIVVKTDSRGHFVANNVAAGPYNISAVGAGGVSSPIQAIKVQPNKPITVAFDLRNNGGAKTAAGGKKKTKFVWMPDQTGSHLGGHWVEVDENATGVPSAQHVNSATGKALHDTQGQDTSVKGPGSH